jgi:hypothetical protein
MIQPTPDPSRRVRARGPCLGDDRPVNLTVDLERALRDFRPHRLATSIPPELRGWILEIEWDRDRLWKIQRPPTSVAMGQLRWHLDLPWWRGGDDDWFKVRPRDVLSDPAGFPEHHARLTRADLRWPIHIIYRRDRWLILDGVHRCAKAELLEADHINAIVLIPSDLPTFAIP